MSNEKNVKILIVEKAIELFEKKGVKNITVQEICNACEITRSAFYYHFRSKEEVLDYYFLSTEVQIAEHLLPLLTLDSSYEQFIRIFDIYMNRTTQSGPKVFGQILNRFIENKNTILSPEDIAMKNIYISLIKSAQERKEILSLVPAEKLVETIVFLSDGLAVYWCHQNGNFDYSKKLKELIDIVLQTKAE